MDHATMMSANAVYCLLLCAIAWASFGVVSESAGASRSSAIRICQTVAVGSGSECVFRRNRKMLTN